MLLQDISVGMIAYSAKPSDSVLTIWVQCGHYYRMRCLCLLSIILLTSKIWAATIASGPMLGYSTMSEVLIWVQTTEPATVTAKYWELGADPASAKLTDPVLTKKETANVAKLLATEVTPGKKYRYEVLVDGVPVQQTYREGYSKSGPIEATFQTPSNWRFRKAGHEVFDFTVAAGSCAYINDGDYDRLNSAPYGGEYEIFEAIYEKQPDLMIWLGDTIYLREPDWSSRTGLLRRWSHDRALPHLRPLLANVHNYAIWDDHDFGPNNSSWDFYNKAQTTEAFSLFWGNPTAGLPETKGIFTYFQWGDVHFYLLDNRTHRDPAALNPEKYEQQKKHFGKQQIDWLISALKSNQSQSRSSYPASFHVICAGSPIVSDNPYPENFRTYTDEFHYLFDRLRSERIDGVFFLTGDVHYTEFSKDSHTVWGYTNKPGEGGWRNVRYTFYDLTVSPLTSGVHTRPAINTKRVTDFAPTEDGTIRQRNFATLSFSGPLGDRIMTIRIYDSSGKLLNQKPDGAEGEVTPVSIIRQTELKVTK